MCRHNCNMKQAQAFVSELLTSFDRRMELPIFSSNEVGCTDVTGLSV